MKTLISNSLKEGRKLASKLEMTFYNFTELEFPDTEKATGISKKIKKPADIIHFKFNNRKSFDEQLFTLFCFLNKFSDKKQTSLILPYLPYLRSYPTPKNEVDRLDFILSQISKRVKNIYLILPHGNIERIKKNHRGVNIFIVDINNQVVEFLKTLGEDLILVSPDKGFSSNVKKISQKSGFKYITLFKKRFSPSKVIIQADRNTKSEILSNKDKTFIIIDDIVSTGDTLVKAGECLKLYGVRKIKFMAIHDTRKKNTTDNINIICSNSLENSRNNNRNLFDIINSIFIAIQGHNSKLK